MEQLKWKAAAPDDMYVCPCVKHFHTTVTNGEHGKLASFSPQTEVLGRGSN